MPPWRADERDPVSTRRRVTGAITFTLDLEHHWYARDDPDRFVAAAESLLELTDELGVRGTVFVLGEVVDRAPGLVTAFAAAGHEIALHGDEHTPLPELTPSALRDDIARGKQRLEDLVQQPVVGYRAPYFSLTPAARHAVEVLAAAGFAYSSSVLPAANPQFGWPGAPAAPFRWPEGIVELPVPVIKRSLRARRGLPFLGGVYLRVLPRVVVDAAIRRAARTQLLWTYCHPYDVDATEPFRTIERLGHAQSRLLWLRRSAMRGRLEHLLRTRAAPPLAARVAAGIDGIVSPPA
jgi:polysaccharide deacetylase family protein (PEP-CTERM system associated)